MNAVLKESVIHSPSGLEAQLMMWARGKDSELKVHTENSERGKQGKQSGSLTTTKRIQASTDLKNWFI